MPVIRAIPRYLQLDKRQCVEWNNINNYLLDRVWLRYAIMPIGTRLIANNMLETLPIVVIEQKLLWQINLFPFYYDS